MSLLRKLKKLDHYRRAALIALPVSLALLLYLIVTGGDGFIVSDWFLDLFIIPGFVGSLISGATYFARILDAKNKINAIGKKEKAGTFIGIGIGLAIGVAATMLHETIPLTSCLADVANAIFSMNQIASFAGFGNRIGSSLDKARLSNEKWAIGVASMLGIAIGLTLFLTGTVACVSLVGFTTIFSGGVALPFWLSGILFVSSLASSFASFGDYSAKAFNFVKSKFKREDVPVKKRVQEKFHEYRGSFIGSNAGLIVGSLIVIALAMTQPHIVSGIIGVVSAAVIVATCISVIGGLCSRIGRLIDGFTQREKPTNDDKRLFPTPKPTTTSHASITAQLNQSPAKITPLPPLPRPKPKPREIITARVSEAGLYKPPVIGLKDNEQIVVDRGFICDFFKMG